MDDLFCSEKTPGAREKSDGAARVINVNPGLRLPDFLRENNAASLAPGVLRELCACHERWSRELICLRLYPREEPRLARGLLYIFLPWEVERQIAESWGRSPSHAYLLHNLAQSLCRAALGKLLPEAGQGGCAPLPELTPTEALALRDAAQTLQSENTPASPPSLAVNPGSRTYSLLTYYPYAGGCEICALRSGCPRLR